MKPSGADRSAAASPPLRGAEVASLLQGFGARSHLAMAWLEPGAPPRLRHATPGFIRLAGADPALPPALCVLLPPATIARLGLLAEAALRSGTVVHAAGIALSAGPDRQACDLELHPVEEADPRGRSVLLVAQPAAAATAAQAALTRSAELMRLAIGAARMFFWDWDIVAGRITWSEGLEEACGLPQGGFSGSVEAFRALVHPEDVARVECQLAAALAGTALYDTEFRMLRGDGSLRWVVARGTVLRDASGRPVRMIGIDLDVTARRAQEEALRASEARLRLAEETAGFGLWDWDARRDVQTWSDRQYALHGLDPAQPPPGFPEWLGRVHPEDRPRLVRAAEQGFRDAHGRYAVTFRLRRADDGQTRWLLALARALETDAEGRPLRLSGVNIDVTDQVELRTELRRTEALLKAIGECTTDAVYAKDEESRLLFANPATLAIIGKPLDEVIGRRDIDWHSDPAQAHATMANDRRVATTGVPEVVEERFDAAGSGTRIFRSAKAPLRDAEGRSVGIVGISSDITAVKQAEERLRDTVAAFEMLVKEADHRIKNSLQLVAGLLRMQANRAGTEDVRAALRAATSRVLAIGQAHRSLYLSPDLRTVDLAQVLRDVATQAHDLAGGDIAVQCDVPATLPLDAERAIPLGLIANELVANALKHAYPPGRLPGPVRVRARAAEGRLVVTVADDGIGSAAGAAGRGLGSTVIEALARQVGAGVAVETGPGRGTATTISLVIGDPAAAEGMPAAASGGPARR